MIFFARFTGYFYAALALCLATLAPLTAQAEVSPIFVMNSLDASVSVIDPASWTETRRISTGKEPHYMYPKPDEKSPHGVWTLDHAACQ